jgi:MFS family permease
LHRNNLVLGIQGVAALVSALPVGYLGDKLPRSRITAFGGLVQLAAVATCLAVVIRGRPLWLLMFSLLLWGVVNTCSYGPLQALYADSIPTGQRSRRGFHRHPAISARRNLCSKRPKQLSVSDILFCKCIYIK